MRRTPSITFALISILLSWSAFASTPETADSTAIPSPETSTQGESRACGQSEFDALLVPAFDDKTQAASSCPAAFCSDDQDCRLNCPSAPNAVCANYQCDYGNGGGGGSGCSGCPAAFCSSDLDCQNNCPRAVSATCQGFTCAYQC